MADSVQLLVPVGLFKSRHEAAQDVGAQRQVGQRARVEQLQQTRHVLVPASAFSKVANS